jgi:hypothetical protein
MPSALIHNILPDLLTREKLNLHSLILLRSCISHIPPFFPSGLKEGELVTLLTRYLVHIDQGKCFP